MGLFDLFRRSDFQAAANAIKGQALSTYLENTERAFVNDVGVDVEAYVKERNLMRVGLSGSAVTFFWSKSPHQKPLQELAYHLNGLYKSFFASLPGSAEDYADATMRYVESNYRLEDPEIVAARLLHNLTQGQAAHLDPLIAAPFVEIVRVLMREVLVTVGDQTKRITS